MSKFKKSEQKQEPVLMVEQEVLPVVEEPTLSFEEWWSIVKKKHNIKDHYFEVVRADFKSRCGKKQKAFAEWNLLAKAFGLF